MKISALGFVSAKEAPEGSLIAYPNGTVILVSEYQTCPEGEMPRRDCYIVGSGEYFCGDFNEKGLLIELTTLYQDAEEVE